jgi:membrane dipeptidase
LITRHVDRLGIDHVGFGSDMAPGSPADDVEWMRKGRWTRGEQQGAPLPDAPPPPEEWMDDFAKINEVAQVLISTGRLTEQQTAAVMGGNFLRVYREGFEPQG